MKRKIKKFKSNCRKEEKKLFYMETEYKDIYISNDGDYIFNQKTNKFLPFYYDETGENFPHVFIDGKKVITEELHYDTWVLNYNFTGYEDFWDNPETF